jgi:hypothetical protein
LTGRSLNTAVVNRWELIVLKPGGHKEMSSFLAGQYSALVYEPKCGGGGGVAVNPPKSKATPGAILAQKTLSKLINI